MVVLPSPSGIPAAASIRGFNITGGAGYNLVPRLGVLGEFGYNQLGLSGSLSAAGAPAGSTRIYSLTLSPIFRFNPRGRFDAYAIGGGGYYPSNH